MADDIITHGPNVIHPETASAVGSRNSLNRHGRDEYAEGRQIIDEEVDKILNHIHARLPPEVLNRAEVLGTLKPKLHTYFNQNSQNMLNRYLTTIEDELGKKVRDMVDLEELKGLNRYTPRPVSYLLDRVGGSDKFHTGEVEKSIVNIFGHLQGHVQREVNDLETHTNSLLRRKTDVGAFVRGENAYAIVKCSFRDHSEKPDTVFDLKLSLNIQSSELISPIFPYNMTMTYLVKDLLANRVQDAIDRELEKIDSNLLDEGKPQLTNEEKIFERIKAMESHVSDEETEGSRRYSILSKKFLDAIDGVNAEISSTDYDALGIRENIFKVIDTANIRNRGFNTAVNALTHVLDWSRMGYQHIENYKTSRRLFLREYEVTDTARLPDERYQIELSYFEAKRINEMREAYIMQLQEFERTFKEVWEVVDQIYIEHRNRSGRDDWDTLSERILAVKVPRRSWFSSTSNEESDEAPPVEARKWNEIMFIMPEPTENQQENPTLEKRVAELKARIPLMREKLVLIFEETAPKLRELVEGRINFLEREFLRFAGFINPFQLNEGLLLDVDITTVKRRSTTMMKMANVLNEFLYSVSKGFQDQAFAGFSRRRSTQKEDLAAEFGTAAGMTEVTTAAPAGEGEEVYK